MSEGQVLSFVMIQLITLWGHCRRSISRVHVHMDVEQSGISSISAVESLGQFDTTQIWCRGVRYVSSLPDN